MGAGVVFRDRGGSFLLVEPTYKASWEIPGGLVEADESPRRAAAREVEEELGFVAEVGRLLVMDWGSANPPKTESVMLLYDGGVLGVPTATLTLQATEIRSARFTTLLEAGALTGRGVVARLAAAQVAITERRLVELEDGIDVGPLAIG
jgi:8-oxo-dGTP diphosphatase